MSTEVSGGSREAMKGREERHCRISPNSRMCLSGNRTFVRIMACLSCLPMLIPLLLEQFSKEYGYIRVRIYIT